MPLKLPEKGESPDPKCGLCGCSVAAETFCFGCKFYLCEDCDEAGSPYGPHDVFHHVNDDFNDEENE